MDGQNRERGKRDQPVRVRLRRDEVIDQLVHLTITNEAEKTKQNSHFFYSPQNAHNQSGATSSHCRRNKSNKNLKPSLVAFKAGPIGIKQRDSHAAASKLNLVIKYAFFLMTPPSHKGQPFFLFLKKQFKINLWTTLSSTLHFCFQI